MEMITHWRNVFESWPDSIPRKGFVVNKLGESTQFSNFMISAGILLLDRDTPDGQGARKIMIGYDQILTVKITAPLDLPRFQVMGFQSPG
ncbi:hypothetical protein [Rubinisphaera sp.]|uniref:hypothetical protein n=1 Tax=Rubinisphaera sp. TaxID=2024857 RepID=UPI000C10CDBC|nr:hypothetical protein [Rubinisphaera sp.]MBV12386.1 hypothetical protein [Rubinisphaera sp.]HCS50558.1 hypothetical protein [Planctomycetaceae bacterium]|tara:strand:+ start:164 stop:433 length:270 start_codon:yes stop_codon:yes gene_type:complete